LQLLEPAIPSAEVGWLAAYWLTHLARRTEHERKARALWHAVMPRVLDELGGRLAPLAARLGQLGVRRVALIPGDRLGLLPLHAAPLLPLAGGGREGVGGPGGGEAFGDRFEVSYAPSATALARCLERMASPPKAAPTLVAVSNPDGSLVFADDEVRSIARRFDGRARLAFGPQARRAWLLDHAAAADFLELSTHASFYPGEPERSALLLAHPHGHTAPLWLADLATSRQPLSLLQADCERLTLDDIWAGRLPLKAGCVVTADACETGQIEPGEEAEESLGFPAAFLSAGAASAIASLWAVDDFSTALLMDRVYERMLEGAQGLAPLRPAAALPRAAAWLRNLPLGEVLARLDGRIGQLQAEKARGGWASLSRAERAQRYHLLSGLEYRRTTLAEAGDDPPFSHPVWWAAFAAYGA
jgi:CHAT domain-containing protein